MRGIWRGEGFEGWGRFSFLLLLRLRVCLVLGERACLALGERASEGGSALRGLEADLLRGLAFCSCSSSSRLLGEGGLRASGDFLDALPEVELYDLFGGQSAHSRRRAGLVRAGGRF